MSDIDRARASQLLRAEGLDALLLFQPEAFRYATGLDAGVAAMWRRGGASIALVPSTAGEPIAAIIADHALRFGATPTTAIELITHPIWIDYVDYSAKPGVDTVTGVGAAYRAQGLGGERPESFDRARVYELLADLIEGRGLARARVGVDLEFIPAADFHALQAALPGVTFVDGSEVLRRLRCIKNAREIKCLRQASEASDAGLINLASQAVPGMAKSRLDALWREGAQAYACRAGFDITGDRAGIAVGRDLVASDPILKPGDLIKADMGVAVDGYLSDSTRSYTMGPASDTVLRLFSVIEDAFEAGLAAIGAGATFGDVHSVVLNATRRCGMPDYYRGHFGHSIGASCGSEEWPFISAANHEEIRPGMVLAFEVPFYHHGHGAMMIEDQLLITETGKDVMTRLPRAMTELAMET